jgi:hypothetical protein
MGHGFGHASRRAGDSASDSLHAEVSGRNAATAITIAALAALPPTFTCLIETTGSKLNLAFAVRLANCLVKAQSVSI